MIKKSTNHIPWDSEIFGMPCYEILEYSAENFNSIRNKKGHYTIRVHPLDSKSLLHQYGFYFCDTLIKVACHQNEFNMNILKGFDLNIQIASKKSELKDFCKKIFVYDRFHRDFNLVTDSADDRFQVWLEKIFDEGSIYLLKNGNEVSGFVGVKDNKLLLHAIFDKFQGKGLSKYYWSKVCENLFTMGHKEIYSSISSSNLAVINLYTSIGFRFMEAHDIYHLLND